MQGTLLSVMWQPGWEGSSGRMATCTRTAESLYCSPETITTLLTGHTPVQNKQFNLEKGYIFLLLYLQTETQNNIRTGLPAWREEGKGQRWEQDIILIFKACVWVSYSNNYVTFLNDTSSDRSPSCIIPLKTQTCRKRTLNLKMKYRRFL